MKIGLNIMPVPAPELAEIGQRAEELGFEGLYFGEHIAVPMDLRTPYQGKISYNGKTMQLECYVALGHLAAVTKKVRLGTGISIIPLREPLQTARAITTVDNLSNGRFDLVIGVGSIEEEFEVMDMDYKTRGARLDEWLDIFDKLWTEDEIAFEGKFKSFRTIGFEPKPVQAGGPPKYFGSHSKVGLARAARRGDGWYGAVFSPEQMLEIKTSLRSMLVENGRDPDNFKYKLIHAAGVAEVPPLDILQTYDKQGADAIIISPFELGVTNAAEKLEAAAKAVQDYLEP